MRKVESLLEGDDRIKALERLAGRLGRDDLPDPVANNLDPVLLWTAFSMNEEEYWGEVEREAQKLLSVHDESSSISRPPGRGKNRGAPDEVAVEPSEDAANKAEALAEVLATMCDDHPEVKRFRRKYLNGRLLTDEEACSFLDERGGPQGTGRAVRKSAPNAKWSLHPHTQRYNTPIEMRKLLGLADKLSKAYGWRVGDALWLVLTGYVPPLRALQVEMFVHTSTEPSRYYNPVSARITVTAPAWVNPEEVEDAFSDAQRQLLRGDAPPTTRDEGTLEVVKFVARWMREHDDETWEDRWKAWKRTNPTGRRYGSYNAFRQVYDRFMRRYVYRKYELPNYKKRERTPYEAYRDDWNDRITRRKDRHAG